MGKGVGEGGCINMDLCTKRGMVYGITDLSEADEICYESLERSADIVQQQKPAQSRLSSSCHQTSTTRWVCCVDVYTSLI